MVDNVVSQLSNCTQRHYNYYHVHQEDSNEVLTLNLRFPTQAVGGAYYIRLFETIELFVFSSMLKMYTQCTNFAQLSRAGAKLIIS